MSNYALTEEKRKAISPEIESYIEYLKGNYACICTYWVHCLVSSKFHKENQEKIDILSGILVKMKKKEYDLEKLETDIYKLKKINDKYGRNFASSFSTLTGIKISTENTEE